MKIIRDFILSNFSFVFAVIICMILVGLCVMTDSMRNYDDTDNILQKERSGLTLYTDNLTGCQYIKGGIFGGMMPRVDGDGTHIGCRDSYNGKKIKGIDSNE